MSEDEASAALPPPGRAWRRLVQTSRNHARMPETDAN